MVISVRHPPVIILEYCAVVQLSHVTRCSLLHCVSINLGQEPYAGDRNSKFVWLGLLLGNTTSSIACLRLNPGKTPILKSAEVSSALKTIPTPMIRTS